MASSEVEEEEWAKYDDKDFEIKKKYTKLKGAAGRKGTDYQLKVLEYFLLQGYQQGDHFRLSTEVQKIAQNFDDVVYETMKKTILLQAKSSEIRINFETLFTLEGTGGFNIYKYLESFPKIHESLIRNIEHVILFTKSQINLKKINNQLNAEIFTNGNDYLKEKEEVAFISSIQGGTKCYTFNTEFMPILVHYIHKQKEDCEKGTIKSFLDKLVLASVSEVDLNKKIENLLKSIDKTGVITSISDDIDTWFKDDNALPLIRKNVEEITYQKISENYMKMRAHRFSLLSDEYTNETSRGNYPNNPPGSIFLFKIDNKKVCDLHIYKLHKLLLKGLIFPYKIKGNRKKILVVDPLSEIHVKKGIIKAFQMPDYVYLILPVVECDLPSEIHDVIRIQRNRKYKKILIISHEDVELPDVKVFKVNIKLEEFSQQVRDSILQYEINFQGNIMHLENVIHKREDNVDELTLLEIIRKGNVTVNRNYKKYEQIIGYVERRFFLFKVNKRLRRNEYFVRRENKGFLNESGHKILCEENKIVEENEFFAKILEESDQKIIVIVDSAGMGKSTILNKIEDFIRKSPYWMIKLNLNQYSGVLYKISRERRTSVKLNEFLPEFSKNSEFENIIFNIPKNVVLLLDALDEISPQYTDLTLNTVKNIASQLNIRKIVITTRPHILIKIEERNIECENYALEPFTDDDVIDCVSTFWRKKLHKENDGVTYEDIKKFAGYLKNELSAKMKWRDIETLIGIPLQTRIIAEIFTEHCKNYLKCGENHLELPKNLDINWLYDEFLKCKRDIYIEEKCNAVGNDEAIEALRKKFDDAINEHIKKALKLIHTFDQDFFKIIDTPVCCEEKTLLKMGIMEKIGDNVQFIHKTFAEYLSAKHIYSLILNDDVGDEFLKSYTPTLWFEPFFLSKFREIFEILLSKGHPVDVRDEDYETPLHYAARTTNTDVVEFLLSKGHPVDVRNNDGQTPLHIAALNLNTDIVEILLDNSHPVDVRTKYGRTPLHNAAGIGNRNIVEMLLNKGHTVNAGANDGQTPLHYASKNGHKDIVEILLDKGHPVDVRADDGQTPLHYASKTGNTDIAVILLDRGHPVDVSTDDGQTPLHMAARKGPTKTVELLLSRGHAVDTRNVVNGQTPLHCAVDSLNPDIVQMLLDEDHPIDVIANDGTTPVFCACIAGNLNILNILLNERIKRTKYKLDTR